MNANLKQAWAIWWNYLIIFTTTLVIIQILAKLVAHIIPYIFDMCKFIKLAGLI